MRVCWIDDDAEFLRLVTAFAAPWRALGTDLRTATTFEPEMLDDADLVVCDLSMRPDGITVVEAAHERGVPTVVVSNLGSPHVSALVREVGAQQVWDKHDLVMDFPGDPRLLLGDG